MTAAPLMLASDLNGRVVVGVHDGDDVAEVRDVVFDPAEQRLTGFTLNQRGWFRGRLKESLPVDAVVAIGPDAVMIERTDSLVSREETPEELSSGASGFDITSVRVLSARGDDLGAIDDVVISAGSDPTVVGYRVTGENGSVFVPVEAQRSLSGDNIVLPATATEFIVEDLSGFGAAVTAHRSRLDGASAGSGEAGGK